MSDGISVPPFDARAAGRAGVPASTHGGTATTEALLGDHRFVRLVQWVYTARLICLALASPAAIFQPAVPLTATASLIMLTVSSLVLSRSAPLIKTFIQHPLVATIDVAISVALLISVDVGSPAALTVICSALAAGLLFPRRTLMILVAPLVVGSFGAPGAIVVDAPGDWRGWLVLVAGVPSLVVGICVVGSVVRHSVSALIEARHEVAEAVAAVGAADERARLARDMHDSVGKTLHGISLGAKALARMVERDPPSARALSVSLADAADQAAREARALLVALRKGQDDRPTVDVLDELLRDWSAQTGVSTHLEAISAVDADPAVTHQMAIALSEILHNIDKHAGATRVEVVLTGQLGSIELEVTDDGVGFDTGATHAREQAGHFGLRGLAERAAQVGGHVDITSSPGKGTSIRWTAQRQLELT